MTGETPIDDMENWQFPEQYLQELEELEPNTPRFNIVQGRLYENMRQDARYTPRNALHVSQELNKGKLDEAFEIVYDKLDKDIGDRQWK